MKLLQKGPFPAQSQGLSPPPVLFARKAQDTWQSYQGELRTAELIAETGLTFSSSLLYEVLFFLLLSISLLTQHRTVHNFIIS